MSEKEIPVGHWAVFYDNDWMMFQVNTKRVKHVTPKLIKFEGDKHPRQAFRSKLIAVFADEVDAKKLAQSIGGIAGEYSRRVDIASKECRDRQQAAEEAGRLSVAKLVAASTGEPS